MSFVLFYRKHEKLSTNSSGLNERSGRSARCRTAFGNKNNLDRFETITEAGRTGRFTVLCPVHPAEILRMDTIIDIVQRRCRTGQLDLDLLESLRLAAGTADQTVGSPVHPANILNMRPVLNPAIRGVEHDTDRLEAFCLTAGTGHRAVVTPILPALILNMRLTGHGGLTGIG